MIPDIVTHYVESIKHRTANSASGGRRSGSRHSCMSTTSRRACRAFIESNSSFRMYNLGGGRLNDVSLRDLIEKVGKMIEIEPMIQEDPRLPSLCLCATFRILTVIDR